MLMGRNKISGSIPPELGQMTQLQFLNLSQNHMTGEIPAQIGNLLLSYNLDLSSNSFSGEKPSDLEQLAYLKVLNVSHNHLSGEIPATVLKMVSVDTYDFSYNNLIGPIPSCVILLKATANSFVGNSGLIKDMKRLTSACKSSKKTPLSEVVKAVEDFHEKYCIGKEGFGKVYKAELESGQVFAAKRLNMSDSNDILAINLQSFQNEIRTLKNLWHHNIIRLYGFFSRRGCIFLLYEHLEKGSLGKALHGVKGVNELGWAMRIKIVQGLAHALSYMHHDCSPPIVHLWCNCQQCIGRAGFRAPTLRFWNSKIVEY
ncbi:MDIS1-interacting receptor like kinase 2-like [Malus domestica]|uniref:MDIS1-interacting receptor like kinase 2-like n=1 Tax=Malus domestica TaxID=3750 RepID=UPI003976256A